MATPEEREETLSAMHDLVTQTLIDAIHEERKSLATGEKVNANLIAKAIDWLKHNNIDLTHRPSKALQALAEALPFPADGDVEDFVR